MAVGYDGAQLGGYMGVLDNLIDRYRKNDPIITKEVFQQLCNDLRATRAKYPNVSFGEKFPIEGKSCSLGFPPMTEVQFLALESKIKMQILNV
ncbi:MAG: hypothetical protein E3K36_01675 [Candidatus Brocadia sp.]|nr:hypothetical protein [Candidatus Brocadia sp.]